MKYILKHLQTIQLYYLQDIPYKYMNEYITKTKFYSYSKI